MTAYRERLTAPPSWWIGAVAFALVWGWVVLVVTTVPIAIVATAAIAAADLYAVWLYGSLQVDVGPESLTVGRATLERRHLAGAKPLTRSEYRARLGPGADARAYLVTRPYLDHGVEITLDDPSDPTPYWLVSTRHPEALADAIGRIDTPAPLHDPIGDAPRGEEVP